MTSEKKEASEMQYIEKRQKNSRKRLLNSKNTKNKTKVQKMNPKDSAFSSEPWEN
jgi:hypothetical protein